MDCHLNLEFLCRVCAANTKGKNSVAECVYILKTVGLRDKLDKFLYLKVFENDALPKVLCKSCYRQVEATASLSKIAKHTQQVFRDFLLSSLPKGTVTAVANSSEFTSSDFSSSKSSEKSQASELNIPPAPANSLAHVTPQPPPSLAQTQQAIPTICPSSSASNTNANTTPRKDEVVVNVSVSDPLTRENQLKVISNSQRRHSIMVEAAEIAAANNSSLYYVPKNIAQNQQKAANSTGNNRKSSSPARVVKFHSIAPKPLEQQATKQVATQQQPPTQVTTFSSGGYVIGPAKNTAATGGAGPGGLTLNNTASGNKEESAKPTNSLLTNSNPNVKDNTILQQKRKNLVKALNNIKANSTGQVSLLKSSQQKQQQLQQQPQSMAQQQTSTQSYTQQLPQQQQQNSPLHDIAHVPDKLPDKIIIAAPKNKATPQKLDKTKDNSVASIIAMVSSNTCGETEKSPSVTPAPKPSFPEDILLGRVIRDVDLLKLILKALKWPTNKQNMEFQLQRLKTSRFTDVMSDSNLLQDTDLTQLLGPYLAPVLMAAQALQQQQQQIIKSTAPAASTCNTISTSTTTSSTSHSNTMQQKLPQKQQSFVGSNLSTMDTNKEEINKAIPYKLPPETSVQLVPALPDEMQTPNAPKLYSTMSLKRSVANEDKTTEPPTKRQRKSGIQKHRDSIVISDEEDNLPLSVAKQRASSKSGSNNFPVDITNPSFLAHLGLLNGGNRDMTNEALLSLLQKQKLAMGGKQQRKNKSKKSNITSLPPSEFDALINIDDDFVLMEPVTTSTNNSNTTTYDTITPTDTNRAADNLNNQELAQLPQQKPNDVFALPSQPQNPVHLITRPIIKRRKTVIQSAKVMGKQQSLLVNSLTIQAAQDTTAKEQTIIRNMNESGGGGGSNQTNLLNTSSIKGKDIPLPTTKLATSEEISKNFNAREYSMTSCTETSPSKQGGNTSTRKQQHKAALGQHLLEAIGLQKIKQTNTVLSQPTEAPSSSTNPPASASGVSATKQSIQQIRSALKKSLKQAQEQQELRNKEISSSAGNTTTTVIQDADSTTKPTIKEIVIEGKSEKNSDNSTTFVDVEEQIDKIALVRNQNATKTVESMRNVAASLLTADKAAEKKNYLQPSKKSLPGRITERRSTLPSSMVRARQKMKQETGASVKEKGSETKIGEQMEKIKTGTVIAHSPKVTSSSAITAEVKEDTTIVTPRRKARKRYTQLVSVPETPSNYNNEQDKEKANENVNEQEKESIKSKESDKESKKEKSKDSEKESDKVKDDEKDKDKQKDMENEKDTKHNEEKSRANDHNKEGTEDLTSNSGRPTRQSKTLSKYYKGPDKPPAERRSLPTRSTRNRKYT